MQSGLIVFARQLRASCRGAILFLLIVFGMFAPAPQTARAANSLLVADMRVSSGFPQQRLKEFLLTFQGQYTRFANYAPDSYAEGILR